MATISITVPSDGTTIDASDVATPLNTIVSEINGSIDSDNIASGGVVPNNLTSGTGTSWAWQSWTPTWTNLTVGNATVNSHYVQIGKTVHFYINLTLGSTSSVSGDVSFTLPVTASSNFTTSQPIGIVRIRDSGVATYMGNTEIKSNADAYARVHNASSTYVAQQSISSTIPMTWATGDTMQIEGTYEAA